MVVEKWVNCVVLLHDKLFSASMTMLFIVTKFVLAIGLASFPGSPRARTKSGKERGEPGKIYHVRNVIGRENLITCGRTNEHAHALLTIS